MKKVKNNSLIMMIGISGSGKSTKAEELSEFYNAIIYSSDQLREELYDDVNDQTHNQELFSELHKRIINDLNNNKSVIYDATNLSLKNRINFFKLMKENKCNPLKIYAYVMSTPFDKCIEQNKKRDRQVPDFVLEKQLKSFEMPFYEEGFDEIYIQGWNEPDKEFDASLYADKIEYNKNTILNAMKGVDQMCKFHKYTLDMHSLLCEKYIVCETEPWTKVMRESAKFHDIGKLFTKVVKEDGNCSYCNHANVGTYYMLSHIDAIDLNSWLDIIYCLVIINYHMRPFDWKKEKTKRKYYKVFGKLLYISLTYFNICDKKACGFEDIDDEGGE